MALRSESMLRRARRQRRQDGIFLVTVIGSSDRKMVWPRTANIPLKVESTQSHVAKARLRVLDDLANRVGDVLPLRVAEVGLGPVDLSQLQGPSE
jgi:hypothetical protein